MCRIVTPVSQCTRSSSRHISPCSSSSGAANGAFGNANYAAAKAGILGLTRTAAAEGARFPNMFVTTSICAASRASILTGLYERTHGFTFGTPPISDKHIGDSYPVRLRAAGYRTGFIGKFGVGIPRGAREKMFDYFQKKKGNISVFARKKRDMTKPTGRCENFTSRCEENAGPESPQLLSPSTRMACPGRPTRPVRSGRVAEVREVEP